MRPRIGLSPCIFPADPVRALFKGKALAYMEQSMADWLYRNGAIPYLVPPQLDGEGLQAYAKDLDGLLLQGGTDVAPQHYNETPLRPEWAGDPRRDEIEMALLRTCFDQGVPILGVCRGAQIMNVAFGGTMYQDITTQIEGALVHRNWDIYDTNFHEIDIEADSRLGRIYQGLTRGTINSVHHQSIKDLAAGFVVTARSCTDQVIEAIEHASSDRYLVGVQWHPEFQIQAQSDLLDPDVIAKDFIKAAVGHQAKR